MSRIIDLSSPLEEDASEAQRVVIKKIDHRSGTGVLVKQLEKIAVFDENNRFEPDDIPGGEFLANEILELSTHNGTHLDAPYHFGSSCEGNPSMTIDKVPLEWCFSDGVLLDVRYKGSCELITRQDVERSLEKIGYSIKPLDIVLMMTGYDRYIGTPKYFKGHPGMSEEATEYICSFGVKIIGIDTFGFDLPFKTMVDNFSKEKDSKYFWPSHFYGRKKEYCHMERLMNLGSIPKPFGFKVSCLPVKISAAGAAWVRAVAIIE